MTAPASGRLARGLAAVLVLAAAGCGPRKSTEQQVASAVKARVEHLEKQGSGVVTGTGNRFVVDNVKGQRVIEAVAETVNGKFVPGKGIDGPVSLQRNKSRLFQEGKPQLDMEAPVAVWDGKQWVANQTAHGKTTDGKTVIDAQQATWTSGKGTLLLHTAKLQGLKDGKVNFTTQGPEALVDGPLVTMTQRSSCRNEEGQMLEADHLQWNRDSGALDAHGNVVVTDNGTRITGEHLVGNSKLNRGRMTGGSRMVMQKLPGKDGDRRLQAKVSRPKKRRNRG